MSPLKIMLLLNIYAFPKPMKEYEHQPSYLESKAMRQAVEDFRQSGITVETATFAALCYEPAPLEGWLTPKGKDLVTRLKLVEAQNTPKSKLSMSAIDEAVKLLRDEHHIKLGTDYSILLKYDQLRILCSKVFYETIEEVFTHYSIPITSITTYTEN